MSQNIKEKMTIVSYFCGCGGLDLGFIGGFTYNNINFEKLPFEIIAAYDFNEQAIETYKQNIGNHAFVKNLADADPKEIPKANILMGGFPCQDFSSCGPLGGLDTERGKLYLSMVRYMKEHKPEIVIGENVPNLEKMNNGAIIDKIVADFEDCGYTFSVWKMEAKKYGVPQDRVRLIFVGIRNDIFSKAGSPEKPLETGVIHPIEWAIGDLVNINDESIPNQSQYFLASRAKNGNGQGDETSKMGEPAYTIRANAKSRVQDSDESEKTENEVVPFQVAYAVSIHKAQGLEYQSVKVVVTNGLEELITHNVFYTAITRACSVLKVYWKPETGERVIKQLVPISNNKDANIIASKYKDLVINLKLK